MNQPNLKINQPINRSINQSTNQISMNQPKKPNRPTNHFHSFTRSIATAARQRGSAPKPRDAPLAASPGSREPAESTDAPSRPSPSAAPGGRIATATVE